MPAATEHLVTLKVQEGPRSLFLAHVYMLQVQHVDMSSELKPSSYNSSKTQRHWMEMGQKQQLLQLWSTGTTHRMQVGGGVATDQ